MRIPAVIHFIWFGGPLPESKFSIIKQWRDSNPKCAIWLWIDGKTATNLKEIYDALLQNQHKKLDIQLKDIDEEKISDDYIQYEIHKLLPNYGAASDFARYKILFNYGGAYFDLDVAPQEGNSLDDKYFNKKHTQPTLVLNNNSQNSGQIGNDSIIVTQFHPQIFMCIDTAQKNYQSIKSIPNLKDNFEFSDDYLEDILSIMFTRDQEGTNPKNLLNDPNHFLEKTKKEIRLRDSYLTRAYLLFDNEERYLAYNFKLNFTITATGPVFLRSIIESSYFGSQQLTLDSDLSKTAVNEGYSDNQLGWLKSSIEPSSDHREVIKKIMDSVYFELKYMRIFCLDQHVDQMLSAYIGDLEAEKLIEFFLEEIKLLFEEKNLDSSSSSSSFHQFSTEDSSPRGLISTDGKELFASLEAIFISGKYEKTIKFCFENDFLHRANFLFSHLELHDGSPNCNSNQKAKKLVSQAFNHVVLSFLEKQGDFNRDMENFFKILFENYETYISSKEKLDWSRIAALQSFFSPQEDENLSFFSEWLSGWQKCGVLNNATVNICLQQSENLIFTIKNLPFSDSSSDSKNDDISDEDNFYSKTDIFDHGNESRSPSPS